MLIKRPGSHNTSTTQDLLDNQAKLHHLGISLKQFICWTIWQQILVLHQVSAERVAQQQAAEEEQQPQAVGDQHLALQHEEDGRADARNRRRWRRRSPDRRFRKSPHRASDEDEAKEDHLCKFLSAAIGQRPRIYLTFWFISSSK